MKLIHHRELFQMVLDDKLAMCCQRNASHFASIKLENGEVIIIHAKKI